MLPETRVHVALNISGVFKNVGHHTLLNRPSEKVELTNSGLLNFGLTVNLKRNALTPAKRIKQTLAVRLELTLVLEVDDELFAVQEVGHVELFGIVGDEPLNHTETDRCGARQKWQNLVNAPRVVIELL